MPIIDPAEYRALKAGTTPAIAAGPLIRLSRDPSDPLKIMTYIVRAELESVPEEELRHWLDDQETDLEAQVGVLQEIKQDISDIP